MCKMLYICCICPYCFCSLIIFFFKQKTAYEMRISDWSSDVCSSDLVADHRHDKRLGAAAIGRTAAAGEADHRRIGVIIGNGDAVRIEKQIGRASCRERVCQYV